MLLHRKPRIREVAPSLSAFVREAAAAKNANLDTPPTSR
jgi:hypothetical protein